MIFTSILILIVAMALPSLNKSISPNLLVRISAIVFISAGVLVFNTLYIQSIGSGIGIYSGLFQVSSLSQYMELFTLIIGALVLISWLSVLNARNNNSNKNYASEYSIVVLFSTLGACLLISSTDLISMYLSIELQSFGVYILSTLYRDSESSTSAGLKYFLLGGLSSCLILLGSGLIYSYTGLTNLESIYSLMSVTPLSNITQGLNLGFILIIVGFLFKIAAAPLHNWAPDVYDDTPTIVTIWLTIMPKISIIIFLIEIYTHIGVINIPSILDFINIYTIDNNLSENINYTLSESTVLVIKNLLLITSLISLIIGTVVGLGQTKIKRLLAYSTISHVGFILLALAINTEQSIDSLIFYIIQYSLTNLNTFLILIAFGLIIKNTAINYSGTERDIKYITELKGQFFSNPLLTLSLSVCLFSMAGIPPLIGFFSKQFVLYSAIQSGYYFMAIIGIIVSIISASYYLKIIRVLHTSISSHSSSAVQAGLDNTPSSGANAQNNNNVEYTSPSSGANSALGLSNIHTYLISSLTLIILFFIFKPSLLLNITRLLSLAIFNY